MVPRTQTMLLGGRPLGRITQAVVSRQTYVAVANMLRLYRRPAQLMYRYLLNAGRYPHRVAVRTPLGTVSPLLHSSHDLLTLNEIFCRLDYVAIPETRVVVDIGSNIGISALYFLTRNEDVFCHLFEPVPSNVHRLRENLEAFEGRYRLREVAVAEFTGSSAFAVEPTGRYGGIGTEWPDQIEVSTVSINEVLRSVLESGPEIDILKIDVEGLEVRLVEAIDADLRGRIRRIYIEASPERPVLPDYFSQRLNGGVCVLDRR
jgi:FkbM family methyltransferase